VSRARRSKLDKLKAMSEQDDERSRKIGEKKVIRKKTQSDQMSSDEMEREEGRITRIVNSVDAGLEKLQEKQEAWIAENTQLREVNETLKEQLKDTLAENDRLRSQLSSLLESNEVYAQAGGLSTAVKNETDSTRQQKKMEKKVKDLQQEKKKLTTQVASLEDENIALRQISAETRQRQWKELQPTSTMTAERQQQTGTDNYITVKYITSRY